MDQEEKYIAGWLLRFGNDPDALGNIYSPETKFTFAEHVPMVDELSNVIDAAHLKRAAEGIWMEGEIHRPLGHFPFSSGYVPPVQRDDHKLHAAEVASTWIDLFGGKR